MTIPAEHQRIVAGAAATLRWQPFDQNGEPVAASGTAPTVTVVGADGTAVSSGTATDAGDDWTYALTAAQTERVDTLTVTWTISGVDAVTTVAVIGGVYLTRAAAIALQPALDAVTAADWPLVRAIAERECERITLRSWVPRHHRETLAAYDRPALLLSYDLVTEVREVIETTGGTATTYTSGVSADVAGLLRKDSGGYWCADTVTVDYVHGTPIPPPDLLEAFAARCRYWANKSKSGIPGKAQTWATDGGMTFRIQTAGPDRTGDDDVDAVYRAKRRMVLV